MAKKGEMGVGTLIVFIAMLLVAAVAAGVLIQTVSSLQEKSLSTGQQARSQISTNAEVIEVSAVDGRNGNLTDFQQLIKLAPGSDSIKLSQVIFAFNTKDVTSTLKYRGTDSICENNNDDGYNTWNEEKLDVVNGTQIELEEDYDDDGVDDYIFLDNTTDSYMVYVNLSSAGLFAVNTSNNLSDVPADGQNINEYVTLENVSEGKTYAYVNVSGTQENNDTLENMVTVIPYRKGEGYFSAIYEQTGTNWVNGNLQRGDVVRLCYESPGQGVSEDQLIRLNFIPKIGTPTLTEFVTPDVISTHRVYLYP